jgi:hypothetical protein
VTAFNESQPERPFYSLFMIDTDLKKILLTVESQHFDINYKQLELPTLHSSIKAFKEQHIYIMGGLNKDGTLST